ncbi:MAG TPA: ATP-binding protein, partial [Bacteroidales bacterium]|nr:ATP-binding protein [Bacteroidales bacterium]
MKRIERIVWFKVIRRYIPYIIFSVIFMLASLRSFADDSYPNLASRLIFSHSHHLLAYSLFTLFIFLSLFLVILCGILIFFSIRLTLSNKDLQEKITRIDEEKRNLSGEKEELAHRLNTIGTRGDESDRFYSMLVQSASDGILYYDKDWKLIYANPAFYSMVGYDAEGFTTIEPRELIHPDDREFFKYRDQKLVEKGYFECELRLRHREGEYFNISERAVQVKDDKDNTLGALVILRDITRIKQVHEELVKANLEAEASSRLKSSFLANISHEIRTPLNSVVGFSNLLLSDNLEKEVKEEYVEQINYNSEKLIQIIGDIIDLSRLESSQIEITYEETSLNSIITEVTEEAKQIIKRNEKSVILNVLNMYGDNSDLIFADRVWLKRVLTHLMDNAIKFTLDGSVELSYMRDNDNIVFKIKDTGIGINKENLARIFEEFRQEINGHHRPFEGLGIGLTLAKEVVERMGGTIHVESEKGIGSEFSFALPYRPAGSIRIKPKTTLEEQFFKPIDWGSKKSLLVDDNKDVLIYLSRILVDTGMSVLMARSGREAIDLIKSHADIDVVLLDMQMPEMNGIEVTKEIRKIRK